MHHQLFSCFKAPHWCPSRKVICSLESWWFEDSQNGLKHFLAPIFSRVMDNRNIFLPSEKYQGHVFCSNAKKSSWTGKDNTKNDCWGPSLKCSKCQPIKSLLCPVYKFLICISYVEAKPFFICFQAKKKGAQSLIPFLLLLPCFQMIFAKLSSFW